MRARAGSRPQASGGRQRRAAPRARLGMRRWGPAARRRAPTHLSFRAGAFAVDLILRFASSLCSARAGTFAVDLRLRLFPVLSAPGHLTIPAPAGRSTVLRFRSRARVLALFVLRAAQRLRLPPEERLRHLPVRLRRRLAQRPGEQKRQKRHRHDRRPDRPRPLFPASRPAGHAFFLFCAPRADFMRFGLTSAGKTRIMNVAAHAPVAQQDRATAS